MELVLLLSSMKDLQLYHCLQNILANKRKHLHAQKAGRTEINFLSTLRHKKWVISSGGTYTRQVGLSSGRSMPILHQVIRSIRLRSSLMACMDMKIRKAQRHLRLNSNT